MMATCVFSIAAVQMIIIIYVRTIQYRKECNDIHFTLYIIII